MQQLDDDMDSLFREAAARYPLKTEGQNWNAVMAGLQQASGHAVPAVTARHRKWYRWCWLLLLTPLFFVGHVPELHNSNGNLTTAQPVNPVMPEAVQKQLPPPPVQGRAKANRYITPGSSGAVTPAQWLNGQQQLLRVATGTSDRIAINEINKDTSRLPADNKPAAEDSTIVVQESAGTSLPLADSSSPVIPGNKRNVTTRGWYTGFLVSPDLSTVKFQQPGKAGYGIGLLVGYRFSKRMAIETGLLWDRKYYYSKGAYLDDKKIPASWNVIDVDGWCRMFEIPLNMRYTFSIQKKGSWYLNAGLSSYIMNRENYAYSYERNNNIVKGSRAYDNETRNWFSVLHTGIGYERELGKWGALRAEPFVKMPLTGLGWGGLPITSFGLNIGITKSFR